MGFIIKAYTIYILCAIMCAICIVYAHIIGIVHVYVVNSMNII